MKARTLANIRKDAPPEDRQDEALKPTPAPADSFRPTHTRYVSVNLRPTTLADLRIACGVYGDAAVEDAQWSAASVWLMRLPPQSDKLSNPSADATRAVWLCKADVRATTGYPSLTGKPFPNLLPELGQADQDAAREVAAATLRDWRRDDFPGLDKAVAREFVYINAVRVAAAERNAVFSNA